MLNEQWTELTDQELDDHVSRIKDNFPTVGETILAGVLWSEGIFVQRQHLRRSIHRTDPVNTALRWHLVLRRRPYCVCGPNSLWHVDDNHKLATGDPQWY